MNILMEFLEMTNLNELVEIKILMKLKRQRLQKLFKKTIATFWFSIT